MTQLKLQIDLNEHSLKQILDKVKAENLFTEEQLDHLDDYSDVVKQFFIRLIQGKTQQTSSRHLTVETINRYIFTLNTLHESEHGHISEVDLRNAIKADLERHKKHEMDKKTLRRIIDYLRKEELLKIKRFLVTIEQVNIHKQKQHNDDPNLSSSDGDYIEDDIDPSDDTEKQYTQ